MISMVILITSQLNAQVDAPARAQHIISPEVHPDQTVTFLIKASDPKSLSYFLDDKGIPYTFSQTSGGHSWPVWGLFVSELLPLFFK